MLNYPLSFFCNYFYLFSYDYEVHNASNFTINIILLIINLLPNKFVNLYDMQINHNQDNQLFTAKTQNTWIKKPKNQPRQTLKRLPKS